MAELHTMQGAIAWSPTNKASAPIANSFHDTLMIQEYAHEQYRLWIVPHNDVPIWGGRMREQEIDELQERYGVDPGAKIWTAMGAPANPSANYQAIETALQALAGQVLNLRTELLVIKALLVEKDQLTER